MQLALAVCNFKDRIKGISTWQNKVSLQKKRKADSELTEKVLYINRCSKVVKGGRKFSFSALILVGDGKGRVGYGFAKANELTDAIRKGGEAARKNMMSFAMEGTTIPHEMHCSLGWCRSAFEASS